MTDFTPVDANVYRLCQLYNDSGVDKIIIFDLSTSDDEHEKNVNTIRNINRNIDIKVCAGGNINRLDIVFSPSRETKIIWRRTKNRLPEIEKSFGAEKSADESQPF